MRHKVSIAACLALLLTLTLVAEATAEGTLSKVRSFFKGRTRSTITGVVDRDNDATSSRPNGRPQPRQRQAETLELTGAPSA
jgi:hypothetical protein